MQLQQTACRYDAVLLYGFGGPSAPQDVRPFVDRVLAGRRVPAQRYEAVLEHYARIGGHSPYNALTRRLARSLRASLEVRAMPPAVEVAFRNAEPFLDDVVLQLAGAGAARVLAVPLAPFGGTHAWERYARECDEAARGAGGAATIECAAPFFDDPLFVRAHASRIAETRARFDVPSLDDVEIVFTAHSIPEADASPYAGQVAASAAAIASAAGARHWSVAYQSRSGSSREAWLGPDVRDMLRALPERGRRDAIVAPIGFLCDHVEVLYDLDVEARAVAAEAGVRLERAPALNDHPLFVAMLAERV